jgi:cleavage and polyadenylation specificity factor subunit 1
VSWRSVTDTVNVMVADDGSLQMWTLPKLTLVFSTTSLATLDNILLDSHEGPAASPPQDPPRKPQEMDIEQVVLTALGESSPDPHLVVCDFYFLNEMT